MEKNDYGWGSVLYGSHEMRTGRHYEDRGREAEGTLRALEQSEAGNSRQRREQLAEVCKAQGLPAGKLQHQPAP